MKFVGRILLIVVLAIAIGFLARAMVGLFGGVGELRDYIFSIFLNQPEGA